MIIKFSQNDFSEALLPFREKAVRLICEKNLLQIVSDADWMAHQWLGLLEEMSGYFRTKWGVTSDEMPLLLDRMFEHWQVMVFPFKPEEPAFFDEVFYRFASLEINLIRASAGRSK